MGLHNARNCKTERTCLLSLCFDRADVDIRPYKVAKH